MIKRREARAVPRRKVGICGAVETSLSCLWDKNARIERRRVNDVQGRLSSWSFMGAEGGQCGWTEHTSEHESVQYEQSQNMRVLEF